MLEKFSEFIEIKKSNIGHTKYSVVIPTFNRIETLKNTINSAIKQNGINDYRIIVVDNNPERNDDTELFLNTINDYRLSYYKNSTNVGMVNNWNQCILVADSDWIVFVHDDDILTKDCLKNIDETLSCHPDVDAVLPNFIQINNPFFKDKYNNTKTKYCCIKSFIKSFFRINMPIAANLFLDNIYGPPTCGLALRRESVVSFGGYSCRCIAADWDFMMHFSRKHKIIKCKKQTGLYLWAVNASLKDSTLERIRNDRICIIKDIVENSFICRLYYKLLQNDFEKKFKSKTTDYVDYSYLYKFIRKYYSLKV